MGVGASLGASGFIIFYLLYMLFSSLAERNMINPDALKAGPYLKKIFFFIGGGMGIVT